MLWMSGVGVQMFAVKPGQILIAQQRGWKTDNVLAFLIDQRSLVVKVEWANHKMTIDQVEKYVEQRRTLDLQDTFSHKRHRTKRKEVKRKLSTRAGKTKPRRRKHHKRSAAK